MKRNAASGDYILGYDNDIVEKINQRSIGREGAFLMPHLRPGMDLLDVGCGPGSLSLGFAQLLENGTVTGIDIEASQIAAAQAAATGMENVRFELADVHQLPFEDSSFDAIFSHTLFMYLARPDLALAELYRVCKPGGVIGLREGLGTFDQLSTVSMNGVRHTLTDFLTKLTDLGAGLPNIGVRLKGFLHGAGFGQIQPSTFNQVYDQPEELGMLSTWYGAMVSGTVGERALAADLLQEHELDELIADIQTWKSSPAAISVVSWIEYTAKKPQSSGG